MDDLHPKNHARCIRCGLRFQAVEDPHVPGIGALCDECNDRRFFDEALRAEQARLAFFAAFNSVQEAMTPIRRTAENAGTTSLYAKLETVTKMLDPLIASRGFSRFLTMEPSTIAEHVRFVIVIRHVEGHEERYGIDALSSRRSPSGWGVSGSYCERILFCKAFGVQIGGDDAFISYLRTCVDGNNAAADTRARAILQRARADLGADLGGGSAIDLLADNMAGSLDSLRALLVRIGERNGSAAPRNERAATQNERGPTRHETLAERDHRRSEER